MIEERFHLFLNPGQKTSDPRRPEAVREEDCVRYFEGSPLCRFMNSLAKLRPEANLLPAGLQLPGGFVRLHIVEKETNRMLWELLDVLARTEAHELEYRFPP